MISIGPIFRKNSIHAGLLILFSLSVHSTLFGLSKNAQDSSDDSVPTKIEIKRGSIAPDFAVTDIDGKNLQLSNFRGKYVLLDFWYTGCGPCIKDTPRLKALSEKFDQDNFEIIGVSTDIRRDKVKNYMQKSHIGWPQILDTIDNNNKVSKMYNIGGYPHYVLIDREGKVMMTNRSFRVMLTLISPLL